METRGGGEFKEKIQRVIRRSRIGKGLEAGMSADDIKRSTRQFEAEKGIAEMLETMESEGGMIPKKIRKLSSKMYRQLHEKYPWVKGVVLLGSSSSGGGKIRELMENYNVGKETPLGDVEYPDYDWGIITDLPEASLEEARTMVNYMTDWVYSLGLVNEFGAELGMPHIETCFMFNPYRFNYQNLNSPEVAEQVLDNHDFEQIAFYLEPTIPKGVGEENRKLILEALRRRKEEDYDGWEYVVENLLDHWKETHELKAKHFDWGGLRSKDTAMLRDIREKSPEILSKRLKKEMEWSGIEEKAKLR